MVGIIRGRRLILGAGLALALAFAPLALRAHATIQSAFAGEKVARVFDQMDLLTEEEELALAERARALSAEFEVEFVLVTRPDNSGEIENIDYADSFFMEHFAANGMPDGITMCLDTTNRTYSINTFGEVRLWVIDSETVAINDSVRDLMRAAEYRAVFDSFLDQASALIAPQYALAQERQALVDSIEIPQAQPGQHVYDFYGLFNDQQEAEIRNQIAAYQKRGSLMVVTADLQSPEQLFYFSNMFPEQNGMGYDATALYIDGATGACYISGGSETQRYRYWELEALQEEITDYIRSGDAMGGVRRYLEQTPEYLNRFLPDMAMIDDAPYMLLISAGIGLVLALVGIGILALVQRSSKASPPDGNVYTPGGLVLSFQKDVLVSSITTRSARPKESDSSTSSGGGSNSGGSSSTY